MAAEAADVLREWRRGERLLRVLPADAAERGSVEAEVEALRAIYQRVTSQTVPRTRDRLEAAMRRLEQSRAVLEAVWSRLDVGEAVDVGEPGDDRDGHDGRDGQDDRDAASAQDAGPSSRR